MQGFQFNLRMPIRCGMVRHPMKKRPIDTAWFLERIAAAGPSYNTVAKLAPHIWGLKGRLDYASLYRMIHGERAMSLSEAKQLARLLGVSLRVIGEHAG